MPRFPFRLCMAITRGLIPAASLASVVGCASGPSLALQSIIPTESIAIDRVESPEGADSTGSPVIESSTISSQAGSIQPVVHDEAMQVVAVATEQSPSQKVASDRVVGIPIDDVAPLPMTDGIGATAVQAPSSIEQSTFLQPNLIDLNLPSALAMVGGQHPVVGFAQWRVREAYAQLDRANVLWLPSIQSGFSFYRHDGNYQAVDGQIVDVNRNSFQYGLGAGAVGAGTTQRPGLVAQFHLADAIFQPEIAEKSAWARGHAASAVLNEQLLRVALAYIELLDAHQDSHILAESRGRAAELAKITADFAEAGEGLQADADRMRTELNLIENRWIASRERIEIASARLAQALSINANSQIMPLDVNAIPLDLVEAGADKSSLISTGLSMRPELKESQALVAAACEAFKREKYAPFVPSVLLGYSTGGFGGGLGNDLSNVAGRYDYNAVVTWEVRNLGFGEHAARRESSARVQQAQFEKLQIMDRVAMEVSEAFSQIEFRRQQIAITQQAIHTAQASYDANSERIRDGEGLPIEVLQSVQALESARRAYLRAVIDFNQAQFNLQWALGWPVSAPADQLVVTEQSQFADSSPIEF